MPRLLARLVALVLPFAVVGIGPAALADSGGSSPGNPPSSDQPEGANACKPDRNPRLRCPDLIMLAPYSRYFRRAGTRLHYHAGNSIVNVGQGPAELFGQRSGPGTMNVTQHVYGVNGRRYDLSSPGRLVFKQIPALGPYWKFENAARFELWSMAPDGRLVRLVRTGPKLVYCLRDLAKRRVLAFSPLARHYPACSQDSRRQSVTLGTSVGWADEYPASYYEQYIDVTGLRGRFAFFQRVDPLNAIRESNEDNNVSPKVILTLPPPRTSARTGSALTPY